MRSRVINHYSRMSIVSGDLGDITGIFEWRLKNVEADPQDHEVAAHMARTFYQWGLPEEGDRWMERVRALAPNSDIFQRLQIDRAHSRGDAADLIAALFYYRFYMSKAGRYQEAYDFLTGLRPEIKSFEKLPGDIQGVLMQWVSIELMTGFTSPEERKVVWEEYAKNLRTNGSWWFEDPISQAVDFMFMGDLDSAIKKALEELAQPLSSWPIRGDDWQDPIWAPITSDPEVVARLSEMKREKQQAREQIHEMLQEPEWNQ